MTESAFYESLGVFFNGADAEVFINLLEKAGLPVHVEFMSFDENPDEFFGMEIFTKKSAFEQAMKIKEDLIDKTLENQDLYLYQIPNEELLKIPHHPEDANDFDYWASLKLIRRKNLPLEERDWEAFRQERMIELYDKKIPKESGLIWVVISMIILGVILLGLTYKRVPVVNILFFAGSLLVAKHLTKPGFPEGERKKGKIFMWISFLMILATLFFTYKFMFN